MAYNIEWLTKNDADEALDFLNLVFSMAKYPHNFKKSLPKIWEGDLSGVERHMAIRTDGRIKAIVGVYPLPVDVAGEKLLFATMGNVASHPLENGRGYMSCLLDEAMKELDRMDVDGARLGGLRQRYVRYGYEPAGSQYQFTLTAHNLKNFYKGMPCKDIVFTKIAPEDTDTLLWCKSLFEKESMWVDRKGALTFYNSVTAWENIPHIATLNGEKIGYITVSPDKTRVNEICALSTEDILSILRAWLETNRFDRISLPVDPYRADLARALQPICEDWNITMPSRFYIRRFDRVANAFMKLKSSITPLAEGSAVINIESFGSIRLFNENGKTGAEKTELAPDLTMNPLEAFRFHFYPLPPYCTSSLPADKAGMLTSWLPLPLGWNTLDRV